MTLVVDSSVAIKWFVPEPHYEEAADLLRSDEVLVAPSLVLAEVANEMWRKERAGEVTAAQTSEAIEELQTMLILRPIDVSLTMSAADIARVAGHSIYDCMFLACALAENAQLVTADAKFVSKLVGERYRGVLRLLTA